MSDWTRRLIDGNQPINPPPGGTYPLFGYAVSRNQLQDLYPESGYVVSRILIQPNKPNQPKLFAKCKPAEGSHSNQKDLQFNQPKRVLENPLQLRVVGNWIQILFTQSVRVYAGTTNQPTK